MRTIKKILSVFICLCIIFTVFALPAGAETKTAALTSGMKNAGLWAPNTAITLTNTGKKNSHAYKKLSFTSSGKIRLMYEDMDEMEDINFSKAVFYNSNGKEIGKCDFPPNYNMDKEWIKVPKGSVYIDFSIYGGESLSEMYYVFISDSGKKIRKSISIKEDQEKDLSVYVKNLSGSPKWESYDYEDGDPFGGIPYYVEVNSKGVITGCFGDEEGLVRAYYKSGDFAEFRITVKELDEDDFVDEKDNYSGSSSASTTSTTTTKPSTTTTTTTTKPSTTTTTTTVNTSTTTTTTSSGGKLSNGTYTYTGSLGKTLSAGAGYASTYSKMTIKDAASGGSYALTIPSPLNYTTGYSWNSQEKKDGQIQTCFRKRTTGSLDDAASYISALKKLGFSVRTQIDESTYRLYGLDYNGRASITHGGVSWVRSYDLVVYVSKSAGEGNIFVYTPSDIGFGSSSSSGAQTLSAKKVLDCRYDSAGRIVYDMSGAIKGCDDEIIIILDANAYKKGDTITLTQFKKYVNSGTAALCKFNVVGKTFTTSSFDVSPDISKYSKINVKILDKVGGYYIIGFNAALTSNSKTLEVQGLAVPNGVKASSGGSLTISSSSSGNTGYQCPYCNHGTCKICDGHGKMTYYIGSGANRYRPPCTKNCNNGRCRVCGGDGWVD